MWLDEVSTSEESVSSDEKVSLTFKFVVTDSASVGYCNGKEEIVNLEEEEFRSNGRDRENERECRRGGHAERRDEMTRFVEKIRALNESKKNARGRKKAKEK